LNEEVTAVMKSESFESKTGSAVIRLVQKRVIAGMDSSSALLFNYPHKLIREAGTGIEKIVASPDKLAVEML
jgi:hypothetical protein